MESSCAPGVGGHRQVEVTGRMVFVGLVAFFAVVAGVNALMMHFAISTFGGVETASSYKAGLAFSQELAAANAQDARNWRVQAAIVSQDGGGIRVDVSTLSAAEQPLHGLTATLRFSHPTDRRLDQSLNMNPVLPGVFSATTAVALVGQWDLIVELERGGERVFRSKSRIVLR